MSRLESSEASRLLRELGHRLELEGGNPYRARAYNRAAETLSLISVPLGQLVAEGRPREIPGVGDALADVISQLHRTGHHPRLATMREQIPGGVLDMLRVLGLRPERVRKLHKELHIVSLADLEDAARSGRLASTKGYGPAFQAKVPRGLETSRGAAGPASASRRGGPRLSRRLDGPDPSAVDAAYAGRRVPARM
jgi:DNA polymerase (family X)